MILGCYPFYADKRQKKCSEEEKEKRRVCTLNVYKLLFLFISVHKCSLRGFVYFNILILFTKILPLHKACRQKRKDEGGIFPVQLFRGVFFLFKVCLGITWYFFVPPFLKNGIFIIYSCIFKWLHLFHLEFPSFAVK